MKVVEIINNSGFELPKYAKPGDSGMDLRAKIDETTSIDSLERKLIPTGIKVRIPKGYEIQIRSRSGQALKKGLIVLNEPGTIDQNYRGEICCIMYNSSNKPVSIEPGERIAQMVLSRVDEMKLFEVDDFDDKTERGESGFGDSGKF